MLSKAIFAKPYYRGIDRQEVESVWVWKTCGYGKHVDVFLHILSRSRLRGHILNNPA